ncbi:disulfide isomerase [Pectobacterium carotovorum subsp. carotovorum]|nr:disulfide isomerase [Pectobacterium carotovorum subsp. carotovorum]
MTKLTTSSPPKAEILPLLDERLTVQIWSDIVCPWCWIGITRLSRALRDFPNIDQVKVTHHAFRLMPGMKPRPVEEVLSEKTRSSRTSAEAMMHQVEQVAAADGLSYKLSGTLNGDTYDAHRIIKLAQQRGRGHEILESFYLGYLSEHASVFDKDSLIALSVRAGLDASEVADVLDSHRFAEELDADQRELQSLGGNGVPFFLIGGRYAISGAQPETIFAQALHQAWQDRPLKIADGAVCGPDGCAI